MIQHIFQVLFFFFLLLILPFGAGNCFLHGTKATMGIRYLFGLSFAMALFEVLALIFTATAWPFHILTIIWASAMGVMSLAGLWRLFSEHKKLVLPRYTRKQILLFVIMIIVVLIPAFYSATHATFCNNDDSYYLAEATTTLYTNTVNQYMPETGSLFKDIIYNYTVAPWPVFWAMFSQLTGLHPAILMRTALPLYLIPLAFFVCYLLAKYLFDDDKENATLATIFIALIYTFGAANGMTKNWWLMAVSWYGKAVGPSIICPLVIYAFILIEHESDAKYRRFLWVWLFFLSVAACLVAATSMVTVPVLLACWGLGYVIRKKDFHIIWKLALVVSPCVALYASRYIL